MVKRYLVGVSLAVLSVLLSVHVTAQVMYPNFCKGLTPSDWLYWIYSCWSMAFAERVLAPFVGGSFQGFIVR